MGMCLILETLWEESLTNDDDDKKRCVFLLKAVTHTHHLFTRSLFSLLSQWGAAEVVEFIILNIGERQKIFISNIIYYVCP